MKSSGYNYNMPYVPFSLPHSRVIAFWDFFIRHIGIDLLFQFLIFFLLDITASCHLFLGICYISFSYSLAFSKPQSLCSAICHPFDMTQPLQSPLLPCRWLVLCISRRSLCSSSFVSIFSFSILIIFLVYSLI